MLSFRPISITNTAIVKKRLAARPKGAYKRILGKDGTQILLGEQDIIGKKAETLSTSPCGISRSRVEDFHA
jgi:hypothetical protein